MTEEYVPVPVAAAADISKQFNKEIVVILAWDEKSQLLHTTTFGAEAKDKLTAAYCGDIAAKALGGKLVEKVVYEDFRLALTQKDTELLDWAQEGVISVTAHPNGWEILWADADNEPETVDPVLFETDSLREALATAWEQQKKDLKAT